MTVAPVAFPTVLYVFSVHSHRHQETKEEEEEEGEAEKRLNEAAA